MRVLAVSSYPVEAAATRFRVHQFAKLLLKVDIDLHLTPFFSSSQFSTLYRSGSMGKKLIGTVGSVANRLVHVVESSAYDLLLTQREAMPFGPGVFERLFQIIGRMPMVLDLDDATYVRYVSPTYGRLGSALKFFGKTDKLIDRSAVVICGNRYIAEYVEARGKEAVVIPTIVDTDVFCPVENGNEIPVVGWIGTHSTFQFLEPLLPVFEELAKKHRFRLRIVGSGKDELEISGVDIESRKWSLDREVSDFQSLDIGLYPLETKGQLDPAWLAGKSGFKAVQYLAVGVPFVMTPVGVCSEIGEPGVTHFNASTAEDWYNHLDKLLSGRDLRKQMGAACRSHSLETYGLEKHANLLASTLRSVLERR